MSWSFSEGFRSSEASVMVYLDYAHKRGGFGPALDPKMGRAALMDRVREFYGQMLPKYPELFAVPRLRNEED